VHTRSCLTALLAALLIVLTAQPAANKVTINIDSPAFLKLPVAVTAFAMPPATGPAEQLAPWFSEKLASCLEITGYFNVVSRRPFSFAQIQRGMQSGEWKSIEAEYLVTQALSQQGAELTVEWRLFDVVRQEQIAGKRYLGRPTDRERMVAQAAEEVLTALTGEGTVFSTQIAFAQKAGRPSDIYRINFTGGSPRRVTAYRSLTLAPRWSPNGRFLAFTSYREGNPDIYVCELATGATRKVAGFRGLNLPGAFAPDGLSMLFASNRDGNEEIYVLRLEGGGTTRLTTHPGIDVSPVWSPDGTRVAFVSSRGGSPQVYIMNSSGGDVRRLTYTGTYNSSPAWSPAGNRIAYEGREGSQFHIFVIDAGGAGAPVQLSPEGVNCEAPTWSPDGRYLAFTARRGGGTQICVVNANGANLRVLYETREAVSGLAWSPRLAPRLLFSG
jgi:TolB protein